MASTDVDTDSASIQANRFGQITFGQRARLKVSSLVSVVSLVIWLCVPVPLGLYALYLAWELVQTQGGLAWYRVLVMLGVAAIIAGLFWSLAVKPLVRQVRLQRDLSGGLIAQAEGQALFERSGYVARINGRPLLASDGSRYVGLAPGSYRFYFLPLTFRLLSAEALTPLMPTHAHAGVIDALAQAHNFDLNDLASNRQGRLSARQRLRLARGVVFLQIVTLGLLGALVWMLLRAPETEPWSALILGALAATTAYFTYKRISDLLAGQVVQVEGFVSRQESSSDDSTT